METATLLEYDGSFNGFLSAVYAAFEYRLQVSGIRKANEPQEVLFSETLEIKTDVAKARRVWEAIEQKNYQAVKQLYFAFLSERKGAEDLIYQYIKALFSPQAGEGCNSLNQLKEVVDAMAHVVALEKKHLETSLKFQRHGGASQVAMVSPKANVLPLIAKYFRTHNAQGSWLVYDKKRKFGLYYHHRQMELLRLSQEEVLRLASLPVRLPADNWLAEPQPHQEMPGNDRKGLHRRGNNRTREFKLQGNNAA